jgi:antitoxin ParD1/3/4
MFIPNIGTFGKSLIMNRNTSVSLGSYFDRFVEGRISVGRYRNASEVIRAGLRLLELEENKMIALRDAIQEGVDSGIAKDFNPEKHLQILKADQNGKI